MCGFTLVQLLVLNLIRPILEQSIEPSLECLLLTFIYANVKFIVICKPQILNDGR